jgi:TonB family protein
MKHPDPPSDRDIHEAFHALDGTIPDGHLDDFSSRVLARLDEPEVSGMDSRELARGSGLNRPGDDEAALAADATAHEAGVTPKREEHSGLHEIKALASTTRRRISQRMSSENEAAESLLVGATSGSFRAAAAALPDPGAAAGESDRAPARSRDRLARPAPRHVPDLDRRPVPSRSSSAPFWMLGGVATAAAAAAVAVFVFGVGREKKDAASPSSPTGEVVAQATGAAPSSDEPTAGSPAPGDMRFAEPPPAEQGAPGAAPAATSAPAVAALDSAPEKKAVEESDGEGGLKGRAGAGGSVDSKSEHASDKADPEREKREENKNGDKSKEKDLKKTAPARKESGGKDLNDVLDEVTGGIQKPTAPVQEEGPKKPSKKSLDRRDVAKAMSAVRSQVMRCRDKEQYEGTVTVKFHVAPSGEVTSAQTTGSKAGTTTGACAAAAVKKAVFPAFDGAPTSFTYPFLLAE